MIALLASSWRLMLWRAALGMMLATDLLATLILYLEWSGTRYRDEHLTSLMSVLLVVLPPVGAALGVRRR